MDPITVMTVIMNPKYRLHELTSTGGTLLMHCFHHRRRVVEDVEEHIGDLTCYTFSREFSGAVEGIISKSILQKRLHEVIK